MSRYEWEQGTIKLPSAEFAAVRKAVADADLKIRQDAFHSTQIFWKGLKPKERTNPQAYREAVETRADLYRRMYPESPSHGLALELLDSVIGFRNPTPRRVLVSDMNYPTNRTTSFRAGSSADIEFDRKTSSVMWIVSENNHAVEQSRNEHLAKVFFAALRRVQWTRNTGGTLFGNDEYNGDPDNGADSGSNYVTHAFGPLGAETSPENTPGYTEASGKQVTRHELDQLAAKRREAEFKAAQAYRKAMRAALR